MAEKVKRNYDAEVYNDEPIPKDTIVISGIADVETSVENITRGPHRGRPQQRFRTTFRVLDGEYEGREFRVNINNQTERMPAGNIDPYGNSKKYCQLCATVIPEWSEDDLLFEDSTGLKKMALENFIGKIAAITVGTFTFKGDDGKSRTVQTVKHMEPLTEELRGALADKIAMFEATMQATAVDADAGLLDDDDDTPF